MTNNIIPEETLIYKELKSKFEVFDPEFWKALSDNLKQVILNNNKHVDFKDTKELSDCFVWNYTQQGYHYWANIADELEYDQH